MEHWSHRVVAQVQIPNILVALAREPNLGTLFGLCVLIRKTRRGLSIFASFL